MKLQSMRLPTSIHKRVHEETWFKSWYDRYKKRKLLMQY